MATAQEQLNNFEAFLDQKGLKYQPQGDTQVSLGFGGGNFSFPHIRVQVFFDEDGTSVHFVAFQVASAPAEKLANALVACNELNQKYRWIKWFVDDDRDINADTDAVIDEATGAEECFEVVMRMTTVIDQAYPTVMQYIYGNN